jgi:hypothetical protein
MNMKTGVLYVLGFALLVLAIGPAAFGRPLILLASSIARAKDPEHPLMCRGDPPQDEACSS